MKERYTAEQLHARMVATVGVLLGVTFFIVVVGFVGGLLFISQPLEQSPNDKEFIDLLKTITVFLTGSLGGIVAANGMKGKKSEDKNNNGTPDHLEGDEASSEKP